jgi:hypothetical protein
MDQLSSVVLDNSYDKLIVLETSFDAANNNADDEVRRRQQSRWKIRKRDSKA